MKPFGLLLLLMLFLSCEEEQIISAGNDLTSLAAASGMKKAKTFAIKGKLDAELITVLPTPNGPCGPETSSRPFFKGVGNLSHIGRISIPGASHCNVPVSEDPFLVEQINGQISFLRPNGDQFDATYTGITEFRFDEQLQVGTLEFVIIGGTGRYEGATGYMVADVVGTLNEVPTTFEVSFEGHITISGKHSNLNPS